MFESLRVRRTAERPPPIMQTPIKRPKPLSPYRPTGYSLTNKKFIFSKSILDKLDGMDLLTLTDESFDLADILNYLYNNTDADIRTEAYAEPYMHVHPDIIYVRGNHRVSNLYNYLDSEDQQTLTDDLELKHFGITVRVADFHSLLGRSSDNDYGFIYDDAYDLLVNCVWKTDAESNQNYISFGALWTDGQVGVPIGKLVTDMIDKFMVSNNIKAQHKQVTFHITDAEQKRMIRNSKSVVDQKKLEYSNAIIAYTDALNISELVTKTSDRLQKALDELTNVIMSQPFISNFYYDMVDGGNGYSTLNLVALRNESIMTPYNEDTDFVIYDTLSNAQRRILRNQGYEDITESSDYKYLDPDLPMNFIMPPARMVVTINYDGYAKVQSWNLLLSPARLLDGKKGYWDRNQVHPHAPNGGQPCYGDFSVPMSDAIHKMDFTSVFIMGNIFCNTYNHHDDAGRMVVNWDQAKP